MSNLTNRNFIMGQQEVEKDRVTQNDRVSPSDDGRNSLNSRDSTGSSGVGGKEALVSFASDYKEILFDLTHLGYDIHFFHPLAQLYVRFVNLIVQVLMLFI